MFLEPQEKHVIIMLEKAKEHTTSGGIILTDSKGNLTPVYGTIVSTNPKDEWLKIGDKVLVRQGVGLNLDLAVGSEKELKLYHTEHVMAVIRPEAKDIKDV